MMKCRATIERFKQVAWMGGLIAAILLWSNTAMAISVVYPTAAHHQHRAKDPAGPPSDSYVVLNPDPIHNVNDFFLLSSISQALKDELAGGDTAFHGWKFDYGFSSLSGTLYVDEYKAGYKGSHHGGGEINLRYKKGASDPENLRWIQLITTTDPLNGATSPYIDPYPNDGKDKAPFYYHTGEIADHTGGSKDYGFGKDYDLHFYDYSSRVHPLPAPFSPITWLAELYLVELRPGKKVTFHDGIKWGWDMHPTPTPEPSSILLVGTGLIGYLGYMYRRKKSLTENKRVRA